MPSEKDKQKRVLKILWASERKISSRSSPSPLVGLQEKETEEGERKRRKARVLLAEFEFKI
jgi:hypothetical protein